MLNSYIYLIHYNLSILGGNFVIKIFTIYECETICLLYLLCCVFENMSIHKPVVSKEGNSEVYVICLGYVGKEKCDSILDSADYYGQFPKVLFKREDLPDSFIRQIIECSRFFTNTQVFNHLSLFYLKTKNYYNYLRQFPMLNMYAP